MARPKRNPLIAVGEPDSMKYFRDWSSARATSKTASSELGEIVKEAATELDVNKWAFKAACDLKIMDPIKAATRLRDFRRLVSEFGVDAQMDLVDELENQEPAA